MWWPSVLLLISDIKNTIWVSTIPRMLFAKCSITNCPKRVKKKPSFLADFYLFRGNEELWLSICMIIALKKAILLSYSKWNSSKRCAAKSFLPRRFDTLPTTSVSLQVFRKQPYSIRKTLRLYSPQLLETQPAGKHLPESYQHWKRESLCTLSPQYEWLSLVKYTIQQFRRTLCRRDPKNGTFLLPFRFFWLWKFIR